MNGCDVKASYSDSTIIIQKFNLSKPQGNKLRFSNNFKQCVSGSIISWTKINLM